MQDLRLALRTLRATPIVTSVAVLSLALGIGATTAIFSLVNSLLLRPFPVKDPQHLVMVSTGHGEVDSQFNYVMLEQMRRLDQFDGSTAWSLGGKSNLTYGGDTRPVEHQFVSGDYFWTLGVPAILGRTLTPADDVPGAGPDGLATVISYGLSQTRFGGAASAVGARVIVDRATVTIVGVTPPQFVGLVVGRGFDITLPIRGQPLVQPATPLSVWASKFVATLLYGLEPRDPARLAGAAVLLAAVGGLSGWLPAYRASRIDPAQVLRNS